MANKPDPKKVPPVATARREPLPSELPKHPAEDASAPQRIKAILDNASARRSDLDLNFIGSDPLRGVRLQLDYEKAELQLTQAGIRNTIVVFGSTRIGEPAADRA